MRVEKPDVSLVIPTHNEGLDVLATIDCIRRNSNGYSLQILVVDDRSNDVSAGELERLAARGNIELVKPTRPGAIAARNEGAASAKADIIGFIDAHCYTPSGWLSPLMQRFDEQPEVSALSPVISDTNDLMAKGYGATWLSDELTMMWLPETSKPSPVPFIGGAATFVRKHAFDLVSGFDDGIVQWGFEDVEFSIRLWLFGFRVEVVPQSIIYHKFRRVFRYDIPHIDILYNKLRLIFLHFDGHRLRRLLRHHLQYTDAEYALEKLYNDGSEQYRDKLKQQRNISMDEFCNKFQLVC